ncbi:hypothetical protein ASC66_14105 [Leifsonia sp. Root4]|uniref:hypothetical protein n=1 Tax=Leifsonia sp. Root4 TaxID=1736525 RepID=UPI0006FB3A87|nr:hypothetical protein [Leifsonia sp. Root4]KQW04842.1 hypothetical protein ASC66_14105 [Leifsonia sp. Root4]
MQPSRPQRTARPSNAAPCSIPDAGATLVAPASGVSGGGPGAHPLGVVYGNEIVLAEMLGERA